MNIVIGTKQKILHAARDLFSYFGFRKTSMDDIARRAEVAKGTIYHYFESKNDVFRAVLRQEIDRVLGQLRVIVEGSQGPRTKLRVLLTSCVRELVSIEKLIVNLSGGNGRQKHIENERLRLEEKKQQALESVLAEGVRTGVFKVPAISATARSLLAVTKGFVRKGEEEMEEFETFIDIALRSFAASESVSG